MTGSKGKYEAPAIIRRDDVKAIMGKHRSWNNPY
jgi:hypothetical protein